MTNNHPAGDVKAGRWLGSVKAISIQKQKICIKSADFFA